MILVAIKGFIYAIAVDIYVFRFAFSGILHCVLHHFTLRFAPFHLAFCTKTHCNQHQNALRFAPYCTAFSSKTHCILLQIDQKWVLVAVSLNKNSFCLYVQLTPFCTKTNLRENRFFARRQAVGDEKVSHNVKIIAENCTNGLVACTRVRATALKSRVCLSLAMRALAGYAALALELCFCCYHWQCVWLLGMPLMANRNLIVAIQNTQPPLTASFLPVESTQNHNRPLARLRLIGRSFIFALFPLFFTVYFRSIRHHMVQPKPIVGACADFV